MSKYNESEVVKLTKELIKFKSTKDNSIQIRKCINYVKNYFDGSGLVIKEYEKNSKPSLFISFNGTLSPKLIFNGHIDVVEAEDNQFDPSVKSGKLYGRGSIDMKGGVASLMLMMKSIATKVEKDNLKKPDIALMIVSDEETGGFDGTAYLLNEIGIRSKFAIGAEPNYMKEGEDINPSKLNIEVKEKGVLVIKVKAKGKAAHGSKPWLGVNAIEALMNEYKEIKKIFENVSGKDKWKTTVNLSKINGGDSYNVVPASAEMVLDIRYTEETSIKEIVEKIEQVISTNIEIEILTEANMLFNEDDCRYISVLKKFIEDKIDKKVDLVVGHGASDLRFFSEKDISSVLIGPYGENYHGVDEFVYIESLELHNKIMTEFVLDYFCTE